MLRQRLLICIQVLLVISVDSASFKTPGCCGSGTVNNTIMDNYELICELKLGTSIPVVKYRSKLTGLHIVLAKVEGPLVNGYFTLATEAQDDDGLPHTLEHLVFLGSEQYPYKGILDLLANRCLASGTNAWTAVDHTAYTVKTGGREGFLNLLPIYLDHLLYPTLTDAGFTTEVYHITGNAEDAGVVYSEMQGRENSAQDLTYLELSRALYPAPTGYRYETGGIMKNLRESISNEKIRKYHAEFYRPENLHIIISGQVEPEEVFTALASFEANIVSKGERAPYTRPWESVVPRLYESVDKAVLYPSDVEDTGLVRVAWRGPSTVTQYNEMLSVEVVAEYLTHSSISPLPRVFVEVDDALASYVYRSQMENSISGIVLSFSGVPKAKIDDVKPLLLLTLKKLCNKEINFQLTIMNNIISNMILKLSNSLETYPHDTVADYAITDALYGHSCINLDERLNKTAWYEHLLKQSEDYWLGLLSRYFTDAPSVTIRGIPSMAEAARLQKETEDRVAARKEKVGEIGLQKWANNVEKATAINEIPPSKEILQSVPVPSIDKINFHSVNAYSNLREFDSESSNSIQHKPSQLNMDALTFKMQVDDLHSNFVQLHAILDTSGVGDNHRPYLPLLLDLLLESSIIRDNTIVSHEDVIKQLAADTIKTETHLGLELGDSPSFTCGPYCNNAVIDLKVDMSKYECGVQWLHEVLFKVQLNPDRIKVKANKLLNSIGEMKRSGSKLMRLMHKDVTFARNTNANQINILRQQKFLQCVLERIEREPDVLVKELQLVLTEITQVDNIVVHLTTNLTILSSKVDLVKPWLKFVPESTSKQDFRLNAVPESRLRTLEDFNGVTGFLTGVGSVESGFLQQSTTSIAYYTHWDLPALMTAIQYLTQLEGPMWKEIRGKGLAYGYRLILSPTDGMLSLYLVKAAQLMNAYKEAINIISDHINGTSPWEDTLLESARSSLIFDVIEREAQLSDVMQQSILAYYRKVNHSYNRDLLGRIATVTLADIKRVALKYFTPLIQPQTSRMVAVCQPSKVKEIEDEMTKVFGHKITVVENIEDSRFSKW